MPRILERILPRGGDGIQSEMQNGPSQGPRETTSLPKAKQTEHIVDGIRTPLHDAATAGDDSLVEQILKSGADRHHKESKHGNTPLHEAAWLGHSRCVKALCALPVRQQPPSTKQVKSAVAQQQGSLHSALLGTRNSLGFSPLHLAAQNGHNQSCREILLAGGDANVQNNYGDTPLHTACRYGHAGATRILLSGNADPQRVNLNGDSALHIACAMGRRKLTRILLSAGSSMETRNSQRETARQICERKKLNEILEILDSPPELVNYGIGSGGGMDQADSGGRDRSSSSSRRKPETRKPGRKDTKHQAKTTAETNHATPKTPAACGPSQTPHPKNWSPYGCHYFPDPKSFPSPKLKTLPKEPLANGEQYYLDLAGNIRKGPVGVGNTCYCGPFFRHIEERISENRKSIKKFVHKATERIDSKVQALANKTGDQLEQIQRTMLEERRHCDGQRLHLEQWLKRGGATRATTVAAHTSKSRKDETNTNTLTRCKSLELLDGGAEMQSSMEGTAAMSRSYGLLNTISLQADVHVACQGEDAYDDEDDICENVDIENNDRTEHRLYFLDSDKEWQYHGSAANDSSDKDRFSVRSVHRSANKEGRSSSRITSGCDSDRQRSSSRHSVAARLEELLSKTNEIIALEKSARRQSDNDDISGATVLGSSTGLQVRKSSKYLDRLRYRTSSRSSGRCVGGEEISGSDNAGGYEDSLGNPQRSSHSRRKAMLSYGSGNTSSAADDSTFQIAEEMEKITASLLGTSVNREHRNHRDHREHRGEFYRDHRTRDPQSQHQTLVTAGSSESYQKRIAQERLVTSSSDQGPVSPEIAKEFISRKEQRVALEKEQESSSLISDGSEQRSIYMPAFASQEAREIIRSQQHGYRSSSSQSRQSVGQTQQVIHDSSIAAMAGSSFGAFYHNTCFDDEVDDNHQGSNSDMEAADADENNAELSEMANIRQLNELKSRILNGGHWMRQQQSSKPTEEADVTAEGSLDAVTDSTDVIDPALNTSASNLGKVRELVALIQGSRNFDKIYARECANKADGDDLASESESSEDEEENQVEAVHDDDIVDGETTHTKPTDILNRVSNELPQYIEHSQQIDMLHSNLTMSVPFTRPKPIVNLPDSIDANDAADEPPPIRFSSYPQSQQMTPTPLLDTRYLIPKDAYFHELPNRPRPKAIMVSNGMSMDLPSDLPPIVPLQYSEHLLAQQPMLSVPVATSSAYQHIPPTSHQVSLADPPQSMLVSTQPIYYQSHQMPVAPQREKLLSNRKFSTLPVAVPMPALRTHHHQPQQAQHHSALGHQQHLIPDTTASNDSGYSARISQSAASPSLSGQSFRMHLDSPEMVDTGNGIYSVRQPPLSADNGGAHATGNYEQYYLGNNIGASSLV